VAAGVEEAVVAKVRARGSLRHRVKGNLHRRGNPRVNLRRKGQGKGKNLRRKARVRDNRHRRVKVNLRDNRHRKAKVSLRNNLRRRVKARGSRRRKTRGVLHRRLASRPALRRTRKRRQTLNKPPGR
jgi:hypothetical protein